MNTVSRIITLTIMFGYETMTCIQAGEPKSNGMSETTSISRSIHTQTIDGTLIKIERRFYVIENLDGKQARLHISKNTKHLNGPKKPGDTIHAEVNKTGHILSIQ